MCWINSKPLTYWIDYSFNHVNNPALLETIRKDAPDLLHVGHDLVFTAVMGPVYFMGRFDQYNLMSPEQVAERENVLRMYVRSLHDAGAKIVIPYIISVAILGNHEKREGFWRFYDNWDKYYRFGLPEKPKRDPVEWTYRHYKHQDNPEFMVYDVCIFNVDWRKYLKFTAEHAVSLGYDGIFVDVNATRCECEECRSLFYQYLLRKYSANEMKSLFGFNSAADVRLGGREEGLLTLETNLFRAEGFTSLFREIRERIGVNRTLIPNCWPMSTISGLLRRRGNGHDPETWTSAVEWIMFEENPGPGTYCPCGQIIYDNILQYKYALAVGFKPAVLNYWVDSLRGRLANIEALAGGGGAFVQPGFIAHGNASLIRRFVDRNQALLEGFHESSDIGLVFLIDQHMRGNVDHLTQVYHLRRYLSDNHYTFSLVTHKHLVANTLSRFRVLIVPEAKYLHASEVNALLEYVSRGGILITTGETGKFNEKGYPAQKPAEMLSQNVELGGGRIFNMQFEKMIPLRKFETFMLDEETDRSTFLDKCKSAHENGLDIPRGTDMLKRILEEAGVKSIAEGAPITLRTNMFDRGDLRAIHLVNYALGDGGFIEVKNILLRINVGRIVQGVEASTLKETFKLDFTYSDRVLEIIVPEVIDYMLVSIKFY